MLKPLGQEPCESFAKVDVAELLTWVGDIDFSEWPQQHRLGDGQIRPAMVNDLAWHGFGVRTDALVDSILREIKPHLSHHHHDHQRMLSVVMPGHAIHPHRDEQAPGWFRRVHVPLVTNDRALLIMRGEPHHLEVGNAYFVDTRLVHEVWNHGEGPRIHFMFDVTL